MPAFLLVIALAVLGSALALSSARAQSAPGDAAPGPAPGPPAVPAPTGPPAAPAAPVPAAQAPVPPAPAAQAPAPAAPAPAPAAQAPAPAVPAPAAPAPAALPQPPAPPSRQGTPATVLSLEDADGIIGKSVRSTGGEDMGRVIDVIVNGDSQPRAAIIDFGGFLGVGSRKVAVDWRAIQFATDGKVGRVTLSLTRNQVRVSPEYKAGEPIVVLGSPPLPPEVGPVARAGVPDQPPAAAPAPAPAQPPAPPTPSP